MGGAIQGGYVAEKEHIRTQLWRLAEELRGTFDGDTPLRVARQAVVAGLAQTWREQALLAQEVGVAEAADPSVVAEFLVAYTSGMPPLRVLDPSAGLKSPSLLLMRPGA